MQKNYIVLTVAKGLVVDVFAFENEKDADKKYIEMVNTEYDTSFDNFPQAWEHEHEMGMDGHENEIKAYALDVVPSSEPRYDRDNEHPEYPVRTWSYATLDRQTLLGYHDWVTEQVYNQATLSPSS